MMKWFVEVRQADRERGGSSGSTTMADGIISRRVEV